MRVVLSLRDPTVVSPVRPPCGLLAEDRTDQTLWEIDDAELLKVLEGHRSDLKARLSTGAPRCQPFRIAMMDYGQEKIDDTVLALLSLTVHDETEYGAGLEGA